MRRLLFDTHAFLWFSNDDPELPESVAAALEDPETALVLSIVSAWEIAIKHGKGKLDLALPFQEFVFEVPALRDIQLLAIEPRHVVRYDTLGFPDPNHRDPFDRMLAAQALEDGLTLVSRDTKLDAYGVARFWG